MTVDEATHADQMGSAARGKALRESTPRSAHAGWTQPSRRPDPVAVLERQARTRVQSLVPIRHGRMLESPLAFFRGSAAIMAGDLAATPRCGLAAQLCGDAHVANFGGFAAPDRALVFDLNDFDETLSGPWEWDLKRFAASCVVLGRQQGLSAADRKQVVLAAAASYRDAMREFADMRTVEVWYARFDLERQYAELAGLLGRESRKKLDRGIEKGRQKDSLRAFSKLTHEVDGQPRIVSDPPLIVPVDELRAEYGNKLTEDDLLMLFEQYRATLSVAVRRLMDDYEVVDLAHKVVGVGSVGMESWILLLLGNGTDDPLFMQIKEAERSVLERFAGTHAPSHHGRRVVDGQRLIQAGSDPTLGWLRLQRGRDGRRHDYYVRQLWDQKMSVPLDDLGADDLAVYAQMCGWTLARAHARTGDRRAIGGYLGRGDVFDRALAEFAEAYADQNQRDYDAFAAAVDAGRLPAETGV